MSHFSAIQYVSSTRNRQHWIPKQRPDFSRLTCASYLMVANTTKRRMKQQCAIADPEAGVGLLVPAAVRHGLQAHVRLDAERGVCQLPADQHFVYIHLPCLLKQVRPSVNAAAGSQMYLFVNRRRLQVQGARRGPWNRHLLSHLTAGH